MLKGVKKVWLKGRSPVVLTGSNATSLKVTLKAREQDEAWHEVSSRVVLKPSSESDGDNQYTGALQREPQKRQQTVVTGVWEKQHKEPPEKQLTGVTGLWEKDVTRIRSANEKSWNWHSRESQQESGSTRCSLSDNQSGVSSKREEDSRWSNASREGVNHIPLGPRRLGMAHDRSRTASRKRDALEIQRRRSFLACDDRSRRSNGQHSGSEIRERRSSVSCDRSRIANRRHISPEIRRDRISIACDRSRAAGGPGNQARHESLAGERPEISRRISTFARRQFQRAAPRVGRAVGKADSRETVERIGQATREKPVRAEAMDRSLVKTPVTPQRRPDVGPKGESARHVPFHSKFLHTMRRPAERERAKAIASKQEDEGKRKLQAIAAERRRRLLQRQALAGARRRDVARSDGKGHGKQSRKTQESGERNPDQVQGATSRRSTGTKQSDRRDAGSHCQSDRRDIGSHGQSDRRDTGSHSQSDRRNAGSHSQSDRRDAGSHSQSDRRDAGSKQRDGKKSSLGSHQRSEDNRQAKTSDRRSEVVNGLPERNVGKLAGLIAKFREYDNLGGDSSAAARNDEVPKPTQSPPERGESRSRHKRDESEKEEYDEYEDILVDSNYNSSKGVNEKDQSLHKKSRGEHLQAGQLVHAERQGRSFSHDGRHPRHSEAPSTPTSVPSASSRGSGNLRSTQAPMSSRSAASVPSRGGNYVGINMAQSAPAPSRGNVNFDGTQGSTASRSGGHDMRDSRAGRETHVEASTFAAHGRSQRRSGEADARSRGYDRPLSNSLDSQHRVNPYVARDRSRSRDRYRSKPHGGRGR